MDVTTDLLTVAEIWQFILFFKMVAADVLNFEKFEILTVARVLGWTGTICIIVPKLAAIGNTVTKIEDIAVFRF